MGKLPAAPPAYFSNECVQSYPQSVGPVFNFNPAGDTPDSTSLFNYLFGSWLAGMKSVILTGPSWISPGTPDVDGVTTAV